MHPDPAGEQPHEPSREPDILRKREPGPGAGAGAEGVDVGEFRQGSPFSQWALARYLVGRAMTESVGTALLLVALLLVALGVLGRFALHSTALLVLLLVLAVGVLLLRWVLLAIVRRLTGFARFGPLEQRMTALVADTKSDVLAELRRIGLPGHVITLPLLAVRLLRRSRRADTLERLTMFETERAVPPARLDALHLLIRQAFSGAVPPPR